MNNPTSSVGDGVPPAAPQFEVRVGPISWERVHLNIEVDVRMGTGAALATGSDLTFALFADEMLYPVAATPLPNGRYDLTMNVTTFADRRAIPNGTWRIVALVGGQPSAIAVLDARRLASLDGMSRVFLYGANNNVYTVSFGIAENEVELEFLIRVYQFTRAPARLTWRSVPRKLRDATIGTAGKRRLASGLYTVLARTIGPRRGQLLFASEQRGAIEGNLLRVHERLVERGLEDRFRIKYSFRLPRDSSWRSTIRLLYLLATSEIILLDDYFAMLGNIDIAGRTKIIQLWHAGSGFKSVGFSRFGNDGSPSLDNAHRVYTYAITGSQHLVPVYAEAFGIEPEAVIPTGLPRVDWFLDEDRTRAFMKEFFAEYPALQGKRIVLFAPTFRGRSIKTAFYDYSLIDFEGLYEATGPDTVVLFRMHHFVTQPIGIPPEFSDRFFDFTTYERGLELLHVTDLLITDFSSIIYEYSLLNRPMLFFVPDKVNYAATRGFHRDFDETAPGRVCESFDEVIRAIADDDYELPKVANFREENFDRVDTGSADRVIDWLILSDPHPFVRVSGRRVRSVPSATSTMLPMQEDEIL